MTAIQSRRHVMVGGTITVVLFLSASGCGVNPSADPGAAEAIVELGDAVNSLRQDNALLQSQIDSLRVQVARQDTLIARLAPR